MHYLRIFLLLSGVLLVSACIGPGDVSPIERTKANAFPQMEGIDLLGRKRQVPQDFEGSYQLVAVAFEREQQAEVDTWIAAADILMKEFEELRFYELPIIYEVNPLYRTWINNGMRAGIPFEKARKRTITIYTDRQRFLEMMDLNADQIYVFLLGEDGTIQWQTSGLATKDKITQLKERLSKQ
jgi:hypothetical protein